MRTKTKIMTWLLWGTSIFASLLVVLSILLIFKLFA